MIAYVLCAAVALHAFRVWRSTRDAMARIGALALVGAVALQAAIGILTLIHMVPIRLGLLHQAGAMLVLTIAVIQLHHSASAEHPNVSAAAML